MDFSTLKAGQLTIGASDFDARPMTRVEDGQRLGYEPDLARAVCTKLGLEPVWLNLPMAEFYSTLQAGKCDVVWFNQAITEERLSHSRFTRPYGYFNEAIIVRADSTIHSADDLRGMKLGGLADSTTLTWENSSKVLSWYRSPVAIRSYPKCWLPCELAISMLWWMTNWC
jgi:polar amino acid transport system substrate-binding protein